MIELVNKQNLLHDLCTLNISLEDMEKVENYIRNYESVTSRLNDDCRDCCDLNEIEMLEEEIYKLNDEINNLTFDSFCGTM